MRYQLKSMQLMGSLLFDWHCVRCWGYRHRTSSSATQSLEGDRLTRKEVNTKLLVP